MGLQSSVVLKVDCWVVLGPGLERALLLEEQAAGAEDCSALSLALPFEAAFPLQALAVRVQQSFPVRPLLRERAEAVLDAWAQAPPQRSLSDALDRVILVRNYHRDRTTRARHGP